MKHENENALPEVAASEQSKQVNPLYEDSSISVLIAQVLSQGVELIRLAGEGKRRFTIYYGGVFLNVYETKVKEDRTHEFVRDLVDVLIDANKGDELKVELLRAIQTMIREIKTFRKELGYGKE